MLVNSFSAFAQTYAKARTGRGTHVTFGGRQAYTDGFTHINLPAFPAGTMLTPWQIKVYNGYLDHEIGHFKYTDMGKLKTWPFTRLSNPLLFNLWNIFEDVRTENLGIKEFPSIKQYLDACTQQIEYDKRDTQDPKEIKLMETQAYQLTQAIYREAYETYRNTKDLTFHLKQTIDQFPELAPIKKELTRLKGLRNEEDARKLAEDVYALLPKDVDWSAQAQQLPQGIKIIFVPFPPGDAVPIDQNTDLSQVSVLFVSLSDKGEAKNRLDQTIEAENAEDQAGQTQPKPKLKGGRRQEWRGATVLPPVGTDHDKIFVKAQEDLGAYQRAKNECSGEIAATKRMLNILLQAKTNKAWERGLPTGRLDGERLASLFTGNTDIFKERRTRQLVDTAVQKMIDESGSMDAAKSQMAAIMTTEAIIGVPRVKLGIAGFTTNHHYYQGTGGRQTGLDIMLYKGFDEPYAKCKGRLGAIEDNGATPLGEGYAYGFEALMARKEKRRVLWITTDGDPAISCQDTRHNEFLLMERIFKKCKRNGIIVLVTNIGRMNPRMKEYCHASFSVSSYKEYPKAVLDVMREIFK